MSTLLKNAPIMKKTAADEALNGRRTEAVKDVAETITVYVGEIIGIITKKSNLEIKSKKYPNLSEKVFAIVELLRNFNLQS